MYVCEKEVGLSEPTIQTPSAGNKLSRAGETAYLSTETRHTLHYTTMPNS